jgi:hypothetical protein
MDMIISHMFFSDAAIQGDYRRGNLARHIRVQHGGQQGAPRSFPCEELGCTSTFRRKDARLKHYRKSHSERLETPPLQVNAITLCVESKQ